MIAALRVMPPNDCNNPPREPPSNGSNLNASMNSTEALCDAVRELSLSLKTAIERLSAKRGERDTRFTKWANAPFVVTLLGGLLGTLLTLTWQGLEHHYAEKAADAKATADANAQYFQRRYDSMYSLMLKFSNEFSRGAGAYLYNYRYYYNWIIAECRKPEGAKCAGTSLFRQDLQGRHWTRLRATPGRNGVPSDHLFLPTADPGHLQEQGGS